METKFKNMLPKTDDVTTNMADFPPFWRNNDPNLENGLHNHGMLYHFFHPQFVTNLMVPFILTRKKIQKSCYNGPPFEVL